MQVNTSMNTDIFNLSYIYESIIFNEVNDPITKTIQHPRVADLKNAMNGLITLGAPFDDDAGLNAPDWTYMMKEPNGYFHSDDYNYGEDILPITAISVLLNILNKYKRTQLDSMGYDYDSEKKWFESEIRKLLGNTSNTDSIIFDYGDISYGKINVTFPTILKPKDYKLVANEYLEKLGIEKVEDSYSGKLEYPVFKYFQKDKTKLGSYYIKKELSEIMADKLYPGVEKIYKNKESEIERNVSKIEPSVGEKPKVELISVEDTKYGKRLLITLGSDEKISKKVYFAIKNAGHTPKILEYKFEDKFNLSSNVDEFNIVKPLMVDDLDISALEEFYANTVDTPVKASNNKYQLTIDYLGKNKMKITPNWRSIPDEHKEFLKQAIKYLFPDLTFANYGYTIAGDYEQYAKLGQLLIKDFNIDDLRKVFITMIKNGNIPPSKTTTLKTTEAVDSEIDSTFNDSMFNLYNLQKRGIEFLYKNKYAILGSETGGGKTVQIVYAAELVYRETQKPILIVTLKSVQQQFVDEIVSVMGEDELDNISTDPMTTKKWNILYYENFQRNNKLDAWMEHLTSQDWAVVIFDEIHKVKHADTKRSQNLLKVADKATSRWGATATISANKPQDVRNQLAILNHPIGKIKEGKFKQEFSGMTPTGYRGGYEENSDFAERIRAAENLNKWLHLAGVYMRHSKEDMKKERGETMYDININTKNDDYIADNSAFTDKLITKIASYKNPDMGLSKLIAYRETIAVEKADASVSLAVKIVDKNQGDSKFDYSASKVLIFTNFIESGEALLEQSRVQLQAINPEWKAYSFLSSTSKKQLENIKGIMEDENSKILVMSMKMGGTGISFPNTFKTMIVNDYDWTPESIEQSEGRIFRINTEQDVDVMYMVDSGADKTLFDSVRKKLELAKIIQTYRDAYQNEDGNNQDSKNLQNIVDAQIKMKEIDVKDQETVEKGISKLLKPIVTESTSSFKNFFSYSAIKNILQ